LFLLVLQNQKQMEEEKKKLGTPTSKAPVWDVNVQSKQISVSLSTTSNTKRSIGLYAASIHDLFPPSLIPKSWIVSKTNNDQFLYQVHDETLCHAILTGISKCYTQISKRSSELSQLDDIYSKKERGLRLEMNRQVYRAETRSIQQYVEPERKTPLSSSLNPAQSLNVQASITFHYDQHLHKNVKNNVPSTTAYPSFPGSIPLSLMRSDIMDLLYSGIFYYVLAAKTNGLRFFVVFCTFFGQRMMILTDRASSVYV
jgi:hypothetical protein